MTIAKVQQGTAADTFGGSSIAPSLTGVTAGNFLALIVYWSTNGFTAPSTPAGWSSVGASQMPTCHANGGFGTGCSLFYKENASGGTNSATVSFGSAVVAAHGFIVEFSGILTASSLDKTNLSANVANGTSGSTGNTATLAQTVELVIALMAGPQVGAATNVGISSPASSGYTALDVTQDNTAKATGQASYLITASNAAQSASWTWTTSGEMAAIIATFQATVATPVGILAAPRERFPLFPLRGPLNQFRDRPQAFSLTATGSGTSALVFGQTGVLTGAGVLAGASALTFGQSGTLVQPGLQGTAALTFGQTGSLTGAGAIAASSALTFGQSATLTAAGILAGASALSFAQTAALVGSGVLTGTSALSFDGSATADQPSGALSGTAAIAFDQSATLSGFGALIGNCQIIFDASGFVPGTAPAEVPAGRRIRNIYRVTIDGQVFEFRTLQEALTLLDQAKKLAAKVAENDALWQIEKPKPKTPEITVSSRELRKAASEAKREITAVYEKAALHAELRMLLEISQRREDDETILLLM